MGQFSVKIPPKTGSLLSGNQQGGRLGLIELKAGKGRLSSAQRERHALLARLGFDLQAVIRVSTEAEAAVEFVHVVRGWLAASAPAAAA